jgi:hypothetical protein
MGDVYCEEGGVGHLRLSTTSTVLRCGWSVVGMGLRSRVSYQPITMASSLSKRSTIRLKRLLTDSLQLL